MGVIEDAQSKAATNAAADAAAVVAGSTAEANTEKVSVETVAATNVLTKTESGKTLFLSHATEFVTTLPAPAAGLEYEFIVADAPESASYTIVTNGGANIIHGIAVSAADAGGSVDTTAGTPADTITFVDGQAAIGDRIRVVSDGTYWYAQGLCNDEDAITFTQT